MTVFVKQYGFYRTGTNYLRALLDQNCDCFVCINHLGCKHNEPMDWNKWLAHPDKFVHDDLPAAVRDGSVRTVVIVKDPYGWLDSFLLYWRRRKRRPRGIMTKNEIVKRVQRFSRLYEIWDRYVATHYGTVIRYESLLQDFEDSFRRLAVEMDIPLINDPPTNINKRVDPHPHLRKRPFSPSFFLDRKYIERLSQQNRDIITEHINWPLFRKWGYEQNR